MIIDPKGNKGNITSFVIGHKKYHDELLLDPNSVVEKYCDLTHTSFKLRFPGEYSILLVDRKGKAISSVFTFQVKNPYLDADIKILNHYTNKLESFLNIGRMAWLDPTTEKQVLNDLLSAVSTYKEEDCIYLAYFYRTLAYYYSKRQLVLDKKENKNNFLPISKSQVKEVAKYLNMFISTSFPSLLMKEQTFSKIVSQYERFELTTEKKELLQIFSKRYPGVDIQARMRHFYE